MSAYLNALREEATREELLLEVERQWLEKLRYESALRRIREYAGLQTYEAHYLLKSIQFLAEGALK